MTAVLDAPTARDAETLVRDKLREGDFTVGHAEPWESQP